MPTIVPSQDAYAAARALQAQLQRMAQEGTRCNAQWLRAMQRTTDDLVLLLEQIVQAEVTP